MKRELIKGIDFEFIEKPNRYGYVHFYPQLNDSTILNRESEPSKISIVYQQYGKNKLRLVLIKNGDYLSNGRISNWWSWYELNDDLTIGEEDCGYGNFFIPKERFKVEVKYEISLLPKEDN